MRACARASKQLAHLGVEPTGDRHTFQFFVMVNDVDAVKMWVLAKGDGCFLDNQ